MPRYNRYLNELKRAARRQAPPDQSRQRQQRQHMLPLQPAERVRRYLDAARPGLDLSPGVRHINILRLGCAMRHKLPAECRPAIADALYALALECKLPKTEARILAKDAAGTNI